MENNGAKLSGIFEIDGEGVVLYSSLKADDGTITRAYDLDGLHFFKQVMKFSNANDLHHRFELFRHSYGATESFDFICNCPDEPRSIQVLLAKLFRGKEGSFLIHLRPKHLAQAQSA